MHSFRVGNSLTQLLEGSTVEDAVLQTAGWRTERACGLALHGATTSELSSTSGSKRSQSVHYADSNALSLLDGECDA